MFWPGREPPHKPVGVECARVRIAWHGRQRDAALPGRTPRNRDETRSGWRDRRRFGYRSSRPRLMQTEGAARAVRQSIPTVGAATTAWFAHSQVSPIFLVGKLTVGRIRTAPGRIRCLRN
jgi:hypothetical protein